MQSQFHRLIAAADAVLGQVQNGELFCHGEPYISRNSVILDELESATEEARRLQALDQGEAA
ncbi:hypothetical protein DK842_21515 [Chromobacterium phragmitis]|uniref:hypothetical protein n=1 Tax=Chromobacterium phragmitis TaxID=2202141 RepID=UPI000DED3229|nr:hypothetical protein [Chromobacterium phragmitis]AXE32261.1 hypothetical protein DK842_21515 [Chromobacterium phragmitis]